MKKEQKSQNGNFMEEIPFQHLAPQDNKEDETVFKALDYALKQDAVKNIAITGTYGSGKSSILQSYEQKRKKHTYLNISLATFACEQENCKGQTESANLEPTDKSCSLKEYEIPETTIQKIEKSILQQIFYRKSGFKLPFSRFRRIRNLSFWGTVGIETLVIILFTYLSIFIKIEDKKLISIVKNQLLFNSGTKTGILSWLFIIVALFCLYFIIRFCNKIKINKLGFQVADIDLDTDQENSLLNKYLDEVLYFFEVTDYDVVVVEDLDRFKNTEIFTKLRELNTLINNYENVDRKVTFIYALRDEVFEDCNRVKFFEFIIPVISVINNQNAGDVLVKKWKTELNGTHFADLDENFLYDVGLYIDDMRLLLNCINEFFIYDDKINKTKNDKGEIAWRDAETAYNRNKIFALILYKNLYPEDFAELTQGKGYLYDVLSSKQELIATKQENLNKEIEELNTDLNNKRNEIPKNIEQLRILYITEILKLCRYNTTAKASQYINDSQFESIKKNSILQVPVNISGSTSINYNFSVIEKQIDPILSYDEREKLIKTSDKDFLNAIYEKNNEIKRVSMASFAELVKDKDVLETCIKQNDASNINKDFVSYLLRNGMIDDDYFEYISYFYEGSITATDKKFLLLIKNKQGPIFSLELNQKENIIKRIELGEWSEPAVLNNSLLDYLVSSKNENILHDFIKTMYLYDKAKFFKQYNCQADYQEYFYNSVYMNVKQYKAWVSTLFDSACLDKFYAFFILANVDKDDSDYKKFCQANKSFLYRNITDAEMQKVIGKIKAYGFFFNLEKEMIPFPIYEAVISNNLFEITKSNFDIIIKTRNKLDDSTEITDYLTQIKSLADEKISNYIYNNLGKVVKTILLPLDKTLSESEDVFVDLLNSDKIDDSSKKELINSNRVQVSDITKVEFVKDKASEQNEDISNLWDCLLENSKVIPSWDNLLHYYEKSAESQMNENLVSWLNNKNNCKILTKISPLTSEEQDDKDSTKYKLVSSFYSNVLENENLQIDAFTNMMKVCPWIYTNLSKYDISVDKIKYLITAKKITFSKENYIGIKNNNKNFLPLYVQTYFAMFIANTDNYEELSDLLMFVQNDALSLSEQESILQKEYAVWSQLTDQTELQKVGKRIIYLKTKNLKHLPVKNIALSLVTDENKSVFDFMLLQSEVLNSKDIIEIISNCDSKYSRLIEKDGKRYSISKDDIPAGIILVLKKYGLISSYKEKDSKYEIIHKRK